MSIRLGHVASTALLLAAIAAQVQAEVVRVELSGYISLGGSSQEYIDSGWVNDAGFTGYFDVDLSDGPKGGRVVGFYMQTGAYELSLETSAPAGVFDDTDFFLGDEFSFTYLLEDALIDRFTGRFIDFSFAAFDSDAIDQVWLLDDLSTFDLAFIEFASVNGSSAAGTITGTQVYVIPAPASLVSMGLIVVGCVRRRRA